MLDDTASGERAKALERALDKVAGQEGLTAEEEDALSALGPRDVQRFAAAWQALPAGARERRLRGLAAASQERLRLDFAELNALGLGDEDDAVRLAAVEGCLDENPKLAARLMEIAERDPSGRVRVAATEGLARFALLGELEGLPEDALRQLRGTLERLADNPREPREVRSAALAALGHFSDEATSERLMAAFADQDLRLGAIRGMGRSADPRWTDRLMPVLGAEDPEMREEAARALAEIEDERAVGPLTDLVDDPEPEVRLAAIAALGAIGGDEAREALVYVLQDEDERVREAAEKAVGEIDFYDDPLAL